MKKAILFLASVTFGFTVLANVPTKNNHGFELTTNHATEKVISVEKIAQPGEEQQVITKPVVKKTAKKENTSVKQVEKTPQETVAAPVPEKISKKEIKKEIKKSQENGGTASLLSYIFGLLAIPLTLWVSWLIGTLLAIAGLILGIVGLNKGSSNKARGIAGIVLNSVVILLSVFLFGIILAI